MRTTDLIPIVAVSLVAAAASAIIEKARRPGTRVLGRFAARFLGLSYAMTALGLLFKLGVIGLAMRLPAVPPRVNFIPFYSIAKFIVEVNPVQIIGNIFVPFPLPILLFFNFPSMTYRRCAWLSLLMIALIEPVQFLINIAIGTAFNVIDIDDLILNLAGGLLGLLTLKPVSRGKTPKGAGR